MSQLYSLGEASLDRLIGGLKEGSLVVILGHPGAGKTTFVAKLLHENIRSLAIRALYISFAETKEKFYYNMSRLGMDFRALEEKGFFKFVHIPTVGATDVVDEIVRIVSEEVLNNNTKIVVIDSITPILTVLGKSRARSFLHAALYGYVTVNKILLILIADLPWGKETVDLGGIEFIADAVLVFKTRMERGLISRWIEVRKFRGSPTPLAEIPFAIVEGVGIKVFPLLPPEEVPPLSTECIRSTGCKLLDEVWGGLPLGASISIIYPPEMNIPSTLLAAIVKMITCNKLRTAIISFKVPGNTLKNALLSYASIYGLDIDTLEKHLILLKSYNPTSYSMLELMGSMISAIEAVKTDLLILHGIEILRDLYTRREFIHMVFNMVQYLRKLGITTIRFVEGILPEDRALVAYSDIVHLIQVENLSSNPIIKHMVWKSMPRYLTRSILHEKPIIFTDDELAEKCFGERRP